RNGIFAKPDSTNGSRIGGESAAGGGCPCSAYMPEADRRVLARSARFERVPVRKRGGPGRTRGDGGAAGTLSAGFETSTSSGGTSMCLASGVVGVGARSAYMLGCRRSTAG